MDQFLDEVDSLVVPDMSTDTPDWCQNCQRLRQDIRKLQDDQVQNFVKLKQKIISTDLLIKKYKSKCDDYDVQCKRADDAIKRADKFQRQSEILETQLKAALLDTEPLRKSTVSLEAELKLKTAKLNSLSDRHLAVESAQVQYEHLARNSAADVDRLEVEKKELMSKLKSLESKKSSKECLKEYKIEVTNLKKENSLLSRSEKRLETKLAAALEKYELLKENKRSPVRGRRRTPSMSCGFMSPKSPLCSPRSQKGSPLVRSHNKQLSAKLASPVPRNAIVSLGELDKPSDVTTDDSSSDNETDSGSICSYAWTFSPLIKCVSPLPPSPACFGQKKSESSSVSVDGDDDISDIADELEHQLIDDNIQDPASPMHIKSETDRQNVPGTSQSTNSDPVFDSDSDTDNTIAETDNDNASHLFDIDGMDNPETDVKLDIVHTRTDNDGATDGTSHDSSKTPETIEKTAEINMDLSKLEENKTPNVLEIMHQTVCMKQESVKEEFVKDEIKSEDKAESNETDKADLSTNEEMLIATKVFTSPKPSHTLSLKEKLATAIEIISPTATKQRLAHKAKPKEILDTSVTKNDSREVLQRATVSERRKSLRRNSSCVKSVDTEDVVEAINEVLSDMNVKLDTDNNIKNDKNKDKDQRTDMLQRNDTEEFTPALTERGERPSVSEFNQDSFDTDVSAALRGDTLSPNRLLDKVSETNQTCHSRDNKLNTIESIDTPSDFNKQNQESITELTEKIKDKSCDNVEKMKTESNSIKEEENSLSNTDTTADEVVEMTIEEQDEPVVKLKTPPSTRASLRRQGAVSGKENSLVHNQKTGNNLSKSPNKFQTKKSVKPFKSKFDPSKFVAFQKSSSGTLADEIDSLRDVNDYDVLDREDTGSLRPKVSPQDWRKLKKAKAKMRKKCGPYVDKDMEITIKEPVVRLTRSKSKQSESETEEISDESVKQGKVLPKTNVAKVNQCQPVKVDLKSPENQTIERKTLDEMSMQIDTKSVILDTEQMQTNKSATENKSLTEETNIGNAQSVERVLRSKRKSTNDLLKDDSKSEQDRNDDQCNKVKQENVESNRIKNETSADLIKNDEIANIVDNDMVGVLDSDKVAENVNDKPQPVRQLSTGFLVQRQSSTKKLGDSDSESSVSLSPPPISNCDSINSHATNICKSFSPRLRLAPNICDTILEENEDIDNVEDGIDNKPAANVGTCVKDGVDGLLMGDSINTPNKNTKTTLKDVPNLSFSDAEKDAETSKLSAKNINKAIDFKTKATDTNKPGCSYHYQDHPSAFKSLSLSEEIASLTMTQSNGCQAANVSRVITCTPDLLDSDSADNTSLFGGVSRVTTPGLDRTSPLSPLPISPFEFIIPISPLPPSPLRDMERMSPLSPEHFDADVELVVEDDNVESDTRDDDTTLPDNVEDENNESKVIPKQVNLEIEVKNEEKQIEVKSEVDNLKDVSEQDLLDSEETGSLQPKMGLQSSEKLKVKLKCRKKCANFDKDVEDQSVIKSDTKTGKTVETDCVNMQQTSSSENSGTAKSVLLSSHKLTLSPMPLLLSPIKSPSGKRTVGKLSDGHSSAFKQVTKPYQRQVRSKSVEVKSSLDIPTCLKSNNIQKKSSNDQINNNNCLDTSMDILTEMESPEKGMSIKSKNNATDILKPVGYKKDEYINNNNLEKLKCSRITKSNTIPNVDLKQTSVKKENITEKNVRPKLTDIAVPNLPKKLSRMDKITKNVKTNLTSHIVLSSVNNTPTPNGKGLNVTETVIPGVMGMSECGAASQVLDTPSGHDNLLATKQKSRQAHRPNINTMKPQISIIDAPVLPPVTVGRKRKSVDSSVVMEKKQCKENILQKQKGESTVTKDESRQMQVYLKSTETADCFVAMVTKDNKDQDVVDRLLEACLECVSRVKTDSLDIVYRHCETETYRDIHTQLPFLNDVERQAINLVQHITTQAELALDWSVCMKKIWDAIFSRAVTASTVGKMSLCRVLTALSLHKGDLETVQLLVYHIVTCGHLSPWLFMVPVVSVWPEIMMCCHGDRPDKVMTPAMTLVLQEVITKLLITQDSDMCRKILLVLKELCNWTGVSGKSDQIVKVLISRLIDIDPETPCLAVFETTKAIELLSRTEGWVWFKDVFISRYGLQTAANKYIAKKIMKPPSPQYLCAILNITGAVVTSLSSSVKLKDIQMITRNWLVPVLMKKEGEAQVCLCCLQLLIELSPFNPASLKTIHTFLTNHDGEPVSHDSIHKLEQLKTQFKLPYSFNEFLHT